MPSSSRDLLTYETEGRHSNHYTMRTGLIELLIILVLCLNRVKNDQGGVRLILEDFSEKDWSVHMGGGCEAHKGP